MRAGKTHVEFSSVMCTNKIFVVCRQRSKNYCIVSPSYVGIIILYPRISLTSSLYPFSSALERYLEDRTHYPGLVLEGAPKGSNQGHDLPHPGQRANLARATTGNDPRCSRFNLLHSRLHPATGRGPGRNSDLPMDPGGAPS